MSGDERLRLFLALRLPDDVLDEVERWQQEQLRNVRVVPREHLHVTLAFLGHRPAGELESIVAALRDAAAGAGEIRLTPVRYRETRSVGMLVLEDEGGQRGSARRGRPGAAGTARRLPQRRSALAAAPHGGALARGGRGSGSSLRRYERSFRPTRLLTYPGCTRRGAVYEVLESVALGG